MSTRPKFRKHMTLPKQYLSPTPLFSLNRVLQEILDELDLETSCHLTLGGNFWVVPTLFDKNRRTFHFACVDDHIWGPKEDEMQSTMESRCRFVNEVMWLLARIKYDPGFENAKKEALSYLPERQEYAVAEQQLNDYLVKLNAPKVIEEELKTAFLENNQSLRKQLQKKFCNDYANDVAVQLNIRKDGRPCTCTQCSKNCKAQAEIDPANYGIFVDCLLTIYHGYPFDRHLLLSGIVYRGLELLHDTVPDWFEGEPLSSVSDEDRGWVYSGNFYYDDKKIQLPHLEDNCDDQYDQGRYRIGDRDVSLHETQDSINITSRKDLKYKYGAELILELCNLLYGQATGEKPILILPIYDVWLGDFGYGGLWGSIICTFEDEAHRNKFKEEKLSQFRSTLEVLASELAMAAVATSASIAIQPPYDLLEHFIRVIVHLQDWDRVTVFPPVGDNTITAEKDYPKHLYCYKRVRAENCLIDKWERCAQCEEPDSCTLSDRTGRILRWADRTDDKKGVWDTALIPELGQEELAMFSGIQCEFEYPRNAFVPTEGVDRELLEYQVMLQQLELLRILIPKVRARRAALRSAVSAIMGRNMSHNIGSHVLARYSAAVSRLGEQRTYRMGGQPEESALESGVDDHRAIFLRYLQRRMDFIAEVSTSEKSFWSQPLWLYDVLAALNLENQYQRINKQKERVEKNYFQPILLSYITGKEGFQASVDISALGETSSLFSCPGGEMGAHALYVILENIIRNSARHNSDLPQDGVVKLDIKIEESPYSHLLKMTIIDRQSNNDVEENVAKINNILENEEVLQDDGSPNPKYWGVREIQICAHYLRNFNMSELGKITEDPPVVKARKYNHGVAPCLSYEIYLLRARLSAIVCTEQVLRDVLTGGQTLEDLNKLCQPYGVQIFLSVSGADELQGYSYVIVQEDFVIEDEGYFLFCVSEKETWIPKLRLPVRTMLVDGTFIKNNVCELLKINKPDMDAWLEPLHEKLLIKYRDKRDTWKNKKVRALVGWQDKEKGVKVHGACTEIFCHAQKANKMVDDQPPNQPFTYKLFGNAIESNKELGCAWVDHAGTIDFRPGNNPNLLSAAKNTGFDSQPFVFSEFLESQSVHRPLLIRQRAGRLSGNELVAAALARVIVLDERIQNEINREYRKLAYNVLWPCMGIWVPDVPSGSKLSSGVTDLNKPNFDEIKAFLKSPAPRDEQLPPDFIVIHLTILENLTKQKPECACEAGTLKALLEGTPSDPRKQHCEVVIVTGRGVPSLTRHNDNGNKGFPVRYLPISALLEYLLARPSKLAVMRALWSAASVRE